MLYGIVDFEQAPNLPHRTLSYEYVALKGAGHGTHMFWPSYKRREKALGLVFSGEPSSNGAAAIVQDDGSVDQPCVDGHVDGQ